MKLSKLGPLWQGFILSVAIMLCSLNAFSQAVQVELWMDEGDGLTTLNNSGIGWENWQLKNNPVWSTDVPFAYDGNSSVYCDQVNKCWINGGSGVIGYEAKNFTFELWIKPEDTPNTYMYFAKAFNSVDMTKKIEFRIKKVLDQGFLELYYWGVDAAIAMRAAGNDTIVWNEWQHVAVTYDTLVGGRLYLNGDSVAAIAAQSQPIFLNASWCVGNASGNSMHGWMDEFRASDFARVPGDGSGTGNTLAWNHTLRPDPAPEGNVNVELWADSEAGAAIENHGVAGLPNCILRDGLFVGDGITAGPVWSDSVRFDYEGNRSLYMRGSNDHIILGNGITDGLANIEEYTVEAWIFPQDKTTNDFQYIVHATNAAGSIKSNLRLRKVNGLWYLYGYTYFADGTSKFVYYNSVSLDQWHHVAMTYDTTNGTKLFYDGAEVKSEATVKPLLALEGDWKVGHPTTMTFQGWIDDIRISDFARVLGDGSSNDGSLAWNASLHAMAATAPALVGPETGIDSVITNPVLSWNASLDAESYRVQVSRDSLLFSADIDEFDVSGTEFGLTDLLEGTTYYWRVGAENENGIYTWSEVWSFTTVPSVVPPAIPTLVSPLDSSYQETVSITFTWNFAGLDVTNYWFEYSDSANFANSVIDSSLTDTTLTLSGFENGKSYWWRVKAQNSAAWGDFSEVRTFTVILVGDVAVELLFDEGTDSLALNHGSAGAPFCRLREMSVGGLGNADGPIWSDETPFEYTGNQSLYFSGDSDNVWLGEGAEHHLNLQNMTVEAWIKPENKTSSVHAYIAIGKTASGSIKFAWRLQYVTDTWYLKAYLYPEAGGFVQLLNPISIDEWHHVAVTYDSTMGAKLYIDGDEVANAEPFGRMLNVDGQWTISHPTTLAFQGYIDNFRISDFARIPGDGSGTGGFLAWNANIPAVEVTAPTLATPADGADDVPVNAVVSWNPSDDALSYRAQTSMYADFREAIDIGNLDATAAVMGDLVPEAEYYWRVGSEDELHRSNWSDVRSFTTVNVVPQSILECWFDEGADTTTANRGSMGPSYFQLRDGVESGDAITIGPRWSDDVPFTYEGNKSLFFDRGNDYVFTGVETGIKTVNFTWEAWIKPQDTTGQHLYLGQVFDATTTVLHFRLQKVGDEYQLRSLLKDYVNGGWSQIRGTGIVLDEWQHVALTYDSLVGSKLYINGEEVASGPPVQAFTMCRYWRIGNATSNFSFYGCMDEVRISDCARVPGDGSGNGGSLAWNASIAQYATDAPNLVNPEDEAVDVVVNPALSWSQIGDATAYRIQVTKQPDFLSFLYVNENSVLDTVVADTGFTVASLLNSTCYYWQVGSINEAGTNNWSDIHSFTSIISRPSIPTLVTPEDSLEIAVDSVVFAWNPCKSEVSGYKLEISDKTDFSSLVIDTLISDTSIVISGFDSNVNYWWRVAAENVAGFSDYSKVNMFAIGVLGLNGENGLPKVFALQQNYPNPFNPVTTISYDVPKQAHIEITIYNILGQKVASLINEEKMPGSYKIIFNASNLSSGMYIYTMQSEGFSSVKKLILLK